MQTGLTPENWRTLIDKIRMGVCTPFIGAGASRPTLPSAKELAERLIIEEEQAHNSRCLLEDRTDLAKVTQYLAVTHEDNLWPKFRIVEHLRRAIRSRSSDEPGVYDLLADLQLPIYLTSNYDDLLYKALAERQRGRVKRDFCRWNKKLMEDHHSVFDDGFDPKKGLPVLYHLHGHTDLPESMVASEDDYLDFLVNVSKDLAASPNASGQKAMLPPRVRRAITNSSLIFFIGYGLNDINLRVILRGLVGSLEPCGRQISLTVQFLPDEERKPDMKAFLEQYYRWTLELKVHWVQSKASSKS